MQRYTVPAPSLLITPALPFCPRQNESPFYSLNPRWFGEERLVQLAMAPNQVLSDEEKLMFIRDGYIVLRGALSEDMVQRALKIVDEAYEDGKYEFDPEKFDAVPRFHDEVSRHPDIIELPERTVIHKAAEDLLGKGKARINRTAQVAFRLKDQSMIDKGMSMTDLIPQFRYHIDGGTGVLGPTGTPFTMLVGICLSSGQDIQENRGQFTAWPGKFFTDTHLLII